MTYCCLHFTGATVPVAAHARWDEKKTKCTLQMFTSRKNAQAFLATLDNPQEIEFLSESVNLLQEDPNEMSEIKFSGAAAFMLASFMLSYYTILDTYTHSADEPGMIGFWGPPMKQAQGDGMIAWFEPDTGYHAVLLHSKTQAKAIVDAWLWFPDNAQRDVSRVIAHWDTSFYSTKKPLHAEGAIAELICKLFMIAYTELPT